MSRWYFIDNGIRNAIIQNFLPLNFRNDVGEVWENFVLMERLKFLEYKRRSVNSYFWRTYDHQELDLVEEENGQLRAYEFKWNPNRKIHAPKAWINAYPEASYQLIHPNNYLSWVTHSSTKS